MELDAKARHFNEVDGLLDGSHVYQAVHLSSSQVGMAQQAVRARALRCESESWTRLLEILRLQLQAYDRLTGLSHVFLILFLLFILLCVCVFPCFSLLGCSKGFLY